ncbi:MAG: hypothetical protein ACRDJL_08605 [Actinomycetota bacterium]
MWVFPLAAAIVSGYFSWLLAIQFADKRRPNVLAWSVALGMFSLASAAAAYGSLAGWSPFIFRTYYLFGAILNVPALALGTLYLLASRRVADGAAVLLAAASTVAAVIVFRASIAGAGLDTEGIPRGAEVLSEGVRLLSRYFSITGFLIVVGGALWSAARLARQRQPHLRRLAGANLLIALGTTVVAVASEMARIATGSVEDVIFAVGLFIGVSVMFAGFLKTRAPRVVP